MTHFAYLLMTKDKPITAYHSRYTVISPTAAIAPYQPGPIRLIRMAHIFKSINCKYVINRLKHDIFHLDLVIIPGLMLARDLALGR